MRAADRGMDDGRWSGKGFPACQERQTVNEWGNESTNADRGRQTAVGQAFQPVRGEGDRQRMGKRINECRPQTADGVGQAFEAVRGEDGEPSTNGERINECGLRTADGRRQRKGARS